MKLEKKRGRNSFLLGILAALLVVFGWVPTAQADRSFTHPAFSPPVVYTGIPTNVRVVITIGDDPKLIPTGVNLIQVKTAGSVVLARMYDDGTHGDITADNGIFTAEINVNEPKPTELIFRVSAAYKGEIRRVLSDPFTLKVLQFPDIEGIWSRFVACLVNKDIEGALSYIDTGRKDEYRHNFNQVGAEKLSYMFSAARNLERKEIVYDRMFYTFTAINLGKEAQGRVTFVLDWDNAWRIYFIGF